MDAAFDRLQAFATEHLNCAPLSDSTRTLLRGPFEQSARRMTCRVVDLAAARVRLARLRMTYACYLERIAKLRSRKHETPDASTKTPRLSTALVWFDSYASSVWVDALAAFLLQNEQGQLWPSTPGIERTACAHASSDVSALFDRRDSRCDAPASAHPLMALLQRATSPGSRGWDAIVRNASIQEGTRSIVHHLFCSLATGSHPCIHPEKRRPWNDRMRILLHTKDSLRSKTRDLMCSCSHVVREAVRLGISVVMEQDFATMHALSAAAHPVANLHIPPHAMPRSGMRESFKAIAMASWTATEKQSCLEDALGNPALVSLTCKWLGKGTTDVITRQSLINAASLVWEASFRSTFVPLWVLANRNGKRVQKLNRVQDSVAKTNDSITLLCASLPEDEQLRVQRLAFLTPGSAEYTLEEAVELMGLDALGARPSRHSNGIRDANWTLAAISSYGPTNAAKIFHFARAALVFGYIGVVPLGDATRRKQTAAVLRRYGSERTPATDEQALATLPNQASNLCVCTSCRRVVNCVAVARLGRTPASEKRRRFSGEAHRERKVDLDFP
jgi:hypothetical protein